MTDIVTPLEEELINDVMENIRDKLNRKPNWTRHELHDLLNEVVKEVQSERRKSTNPKIQREHT